MPNYLELLGISDAELSNVDPVEMNLLVAKSIPCLAELDIGHYQQLVDGWAEGVRRRLPHAEKVFQQEPRRWKNDVNFIRLAILAEHLDRSVGMRYKEEHEDLKAVWYTDPSDLFLNGVMDTRQGTCSNMALLCIAIGWRLGWPVSLACARAHCFCRFDDGRVTYNLEASRSGRGGFCAPEDEEYIRDYGLSAKAVNSGSDLRALKPREMLGVFVGLRARHMRDIGNLIEAEKDYLLARHLFPVNQYLYSQAMGVAILRGAELFAPDEEGTPLSLADWIIQRFGDNRRVARRQSMPSSALDVGYTIKL